jgi:hypothetical protein
MYIYIPSEPEPVPLNFPLLEKPLSVAVPSYSLSFLSNDCVLSYPLRDENSKE